MNNFELLSLFSTSLLFFTGVFTLDGGRRACSHRRWTRPDLCFTGANGKALPKEASILAVFINLIFVGAMLFYGYAVVREELDSSKKATAKALHNQVPSPLH